MKYLTSDHETDRQSLLVWYRKNQRDLPWRRNQTAYTIWISEVMLQQTTVCVVIPYFERFIHKFPTLKDLASARIEEVYESWSGLGYYSRARNLHQAAQKIQVHGFPKSYEKLMSYPGFGPYTSRAVASIAFNEPVGVIDGNVIRVLTRRFGLSIQWWKSPQRKQLQNIADVLAQECPAEVNQALMELGALICTPTQPACLLCPMQSRCQAHHDQSVDLVPLKKPRKKREVWIWEPLIVKQNDQFALIKNDYAPFLKNQWIFPGKAYSQKDAPRNYHYRHSITHHDIFVTTKFKYNVPKKWIQSVHWVVKDKIHHFSPTSLIRKALSEYEQVECP